MASVVMRPPEDFSIARGGTTIGGEWSGTAGSGASVVSCPSGFGWALAKDTSVVNNHIATRICSASGIGFAAFLKLDMPSGDTTWRPIYRIFTNGSNAATWLTYRPSSNEFRIEYNAGGGNVAQGTTVTAGPAVPSTVFHIAVAATTAGAVKIWIDGTLITNVTGVSIGSSYNRESLYCPTSTGAGQTTMGNVVLWEPSTHTWDGKVKVVERLAPTGDVSATGTWTLSGAGATSRWGVLDEALVQSINSTTGTSARVTLADMAQVPDEIYGLWVYSRQQGTGQGGLTLHEPGYDYVTANYTNTASYIREYVAGPNAGGDWDQTSLNALELSVTRASGTVQFFYAHVLVLRTLDEAVGDVDAFPGEGTLAFTGYPSGLTLSATLAPAQDAVLFTGYPATVDTGVSYAPAPADLVFTGLSASVTLSASLAPAQEVVSFTGRAVSIVLDAEASPSPDALTLTGHAVSVSLSVTLSPSQGGLAFSGLPASAEAGADIGPTPDAVFLTGLPASFVIDAGLSPSAIAMSFTGLAASLSLTEDAAGVRSGRFALIEQAAIFALTERGQASRASKQGVSVHG